MPIDWNGCPAVRARPDHVSGAAALIDDPRVPANTIVANMDEGTNAEEIVEIFGLKTRLADVLSIYNYAKNQTG